MKKIIGSFLTVVITLSAVCLYPLHSNQCFSVKAECMAAGATVGEWDSIYFGRYWQSDTNGDGIADTGDNKEPVQWRILDRRGNYALLLSDKILDAGKFYAGGDGASWENSDVRNWLNTAFYREAFNDAERKAISVQTLSNKWNLVIGENDINDTKDKVFLLSYEELTSRAFALGGYLDVFNTRCAALTGFTATKPGMYSEAGCGDKWWLRTSGHTLEEALLVTYGLISNDDINTIAGIRPAIYVNLSNTSLWSDGGRVLAEDLPEGKVINEVKDESSGNLPIADELPEWAGTVVPPQGDSGLDGPAMSELNIAHFNFTKYSEGGKESSNFSKNNYDASRYGRIVCSYIEQLENGTYQRVEKCDDGIYVERYTASFALLDSHKIEMALPLFGGCFSSDTYNFLVFGQENTDEDESREVMRIVKYDRDWNELDACSISGINTCIPFKSGSLRMTEADGILYIHTCHQMYRSEDGLNHQANMTFAVDMLTMETVHRRYTVNNVSSGYVSHSFNQFIVTDGTYIYRLDHGDAYPRSIVATKCSVDDMKSNDTDANTGSKTGCDNGNYYGCDYTTVLPIAGMTGDNNTGVSIGGFELCGSSLITAGNSYAQSDSDYNTDGQRNIFVAVTDTMMSDTAVHWITDYKGEDGIGVGNPHLVPCGNGFLLMWEENNINEGATLTKLVELDSEGNTKGKIYTVYARLSDCRPILTSGGKLLWYMTANGSPVFYSLDTDKLADYEYNGRGSMRDCTITLDRDSYEYPGEQGPYTPSPLVKYGDYVLKAERDYRVTYSDNHIPGTAKVIVEGQGFFKGSKEVEFKINGTVSNLPVNTENKHDVPNVTRNTKTTYGLLHGIDSTSDDMDNEIDYPDVVKGVKVKKGSKKAFRVSWKKRKNVYFYRIQIAKNRKFTKGKKTKTSYTGKVSFKGLRRKSVYYVRVRAVNKYNGREYCGKWSTVKKIRIL